MIKPALALSLALAAHPAAAIEASPEAYEFLHSLVRGDFLKKSLLTPSGSQELKTKLRTRARQLRECVTNDWELPTTIRALGEEKLTLGYLAALDEPYGLSQGDTLQGQLEKDWDELYNFDKAKITAYARFWSILHSGAASPERDNLQDLVRDWRGHIMALKDAHEAAADNLFAQRRKKK